MSQKIFGVRKLQSPGLAIVRRYLRGARFSRLSRLPTCDTRTHDDGKYRAGNKSLRCRR